MLRLYLRAGIPLFLLLALPMLVIRAQRYDDSDVRELLLNNGCAAPCFLGIQPGITTANDALAILRNSQWVDSASIAYRDSDYGGGAVWSWTKLASPLLGKKQGGFVSSPRNGVQVVDLLRITTVVASGDAYLILGTSPFTMIGETGMRDEAYVARFYPEHGISVWSNFRCPSLNDRIWRRPIMVQFRISGATPQTITPASTC